MEKGKGRGRGRGRGSAEQQPGSQRPPTTGGRPGPSSQGLPHHQQAPRHVPAGQPSTSAWGPRSQVQQQHQIRAPAPQTQVQPGGRATLREGYEASAPGPERTHSVAVAGGGDVGTMHSGRGAVRGRRPLQVILRTRPDKLATKQGTFGNSIRLKANYFKLMQTPNWCLYQYSVDFAPPEDHTGRKKYLFRQGIRGTLAGYIYDGTNMYAAQKISPDPMELHVQHEESETTYRITIKLVGDVTAGDYQYIQFFNIIMRKCMGNLNLQLVGRNFFDAKAKIGIPEHRMELWPGYVTSIRQHENAVLMCAEITHKVMRNDTVLHLLQDCIQEGRGDYRRNFVTSIVGSVVLTDYNNRTYHIDDVDFNTTPQSVFSKRDGTSISYVDYFKQRYNLVIRQLEQPMLVSRAKAREIRAGMAETVYLVPELCRMTGLTNTQRANFNLMRALADYTRVGPGPRIDKLLNFSRRLLSNEKIVEELRQWDMQLANNLVEFSGRVLPPEDILTARNGKYSGGMSADWTKFVRSSPMLHTPNMDLWYVVCPNRLTHSAKSFVQNVIKVASGMQWRLPMPKLQEIQDDRPGSYLSALESIMSSGNKPTLIMCIASNNKADRYAAIKKKCCVDRAVPTQVVLAKNLESKGVMSIATKVAIQMNCKIGGAPWTVNIPIKTMMVVGFDVCHDTNQRGQSFGAMVATLDPFCTRYFSVVTPHTNDEELSKDIAINTVKACQEYKANTGRLPELILFYRDGVGDGQLPYVYNTEVQAILKLLKESLYHDQEVKMCFVVVSKRINTRFFGPDHSNPSNPANPPPGCVVDDCVTLPERYDFFIVSQCVRQGTVSPTSYNIIYDTMGKTADQIQRITYKMTHLYYNWSGTVRVPAPCQYAHKLAFLTAQSLHREPSAELARVLYYL
ncbi:piwi-like protein Siwi [Agrilus planipennis]|uniref:Piwi-like protein Siwi n=1 Tax=Agrilus planipennis TaxID=224129 RepID=A0A1W4XLK3_AGRPL|nr:piwi-like protein Siwi [Agrilus planipennis]XP_018333349.1 piwi-like protein Siwi [Agrilus planipennis]